MDNEAIEVMIMGVIPNGVKVGFIKCNLHYDLVSMNPIRSIHISYSMGTEFLDTMHHKIEGYLTSKNLNQMLSDVSESISVDYINYKTEAFEKETKKNTIKFGALGRMPNHSDLVRKKCAEIKAEIDTRCNAKPILVGNASTNIDVENVSIKIAGEEVKICKAKLSITKADKETSESVEKPWSISVKDFLDVR